MTFASQIDRSPTSCNEVLTAGSALYIHLLDNFTIVPPTAAIVANAIINTSATTADLRLDTATYSPQSLKAGSVLYFPNQATFIVLSDDVSLTDTAQTVNIDNPPAVTIPASESVDFYPNTYKLVNATDLPFDMPSSTQERVDLRSIQGGSLKDRINLSIAASCVSTKTDLGLWTVIFMAAKSSKFVYATAIDSLDKTTFGKSLINGYSENGGVDQVKRSSFTVDFLNGDYQIYAPYNTLSAPDQLIVNDERSKLLLPRLN